MTRKSLTMTASFIIGLLHHDTAILEPGFALWQIGKLCCLSPLQSCLSKGGASTAVLDSPKMGLAIPVCCVQAMKPVQHGLLIN